MGELHKCVSVPGEKAVPSLPDQSSFYALICPFLLFTNSPSSPSCQPLFSTSFFDSHPLKTLFLTINPPPPISLLRSQNNALNVPSSLMALYTELPDSDSTVQTEFNHLNTSNPLVAKSMENPQKPMENTRILLLVERYTATCIPDTSSSLDLFQYFFSISRNPLTSSEPSCLDFLPPPSLNNSGSRVSVLIPLLISYALLR